MKNRNKQLGMSMIEVMMVLLITTIITGAVFSQIANIQKRANFEQTKLDLFQEARDFMDQMSRDLHQAGYPSPRNFASGDIAGATDSKTAVGLVKVSSSELRFEGDVDGTGTVQSLRYELVTDGDNCPCLRRSQIAKISGNPLTGQGTPAWYTEVQNVENGSDSDPIFYAYTGGGTPVTLPVDYNSDASTIASIDTIKIVIRTQAKYTDPQTKTRPVATLVSTIRLNNCSQAAYAQAMSCQ